MTEYQGWRLNINGTVLNDTLVSKGSYTFKKEKRLSGKWVDLNGLTHEDVLASRKVLITFNLRERNLEEQEAIKAIFEHTERVAVTYWDDYACEYNGGTFVMTAPTINHMTIEPNGIVYAATSVKLEEY